MNYRHNEGRILGDIRAITKRIQRRRFQEATETEKTRLIELREELANLKRGIGNTDV